jgi:hypothetical protein
MATERGDVSRVAVSGLSSGELVRETPTVIRPEPARAPAGETSEAGFLEAPK